MVGQKGYFFHLSISLTDEYNTFRIHSTAVTKYTPAKALVFYLALVTCCELPLPLPIVQTISVGHRPNH